MRDMIYPVICGLGNAAALTSSPPFAEGDDAANVPPEEDKCGPKKNCKYIADPGHPTPVIQTGGEGEC